MSPVRRVFRAAKVVQFGYYSFAQSGRGFRVERCFTRTWEDLCRTTDRRTLSKLLLVAVEAAFCFFSAWFSARRGRSRCNQIRRTQIVFTSNADQRKEGITTSIGQ